MIRKFREVEKENQDMNCDEIDAFQENKNNFNLEFTSRKSTKDLKERDEIKTFCRIRHIVNDLGKNIINKV